MACSSTLRAASKLRSCLKRRAYYNRNASLKIRRPEDVNYNLANRLLRTKHESWSYEQELRLFVQLNDSPDANGLRWFDFGPNLELKEVVVGAQCDPKDIEAVKDVLKGYGRTVEC